MRLARIIGALVALILTASLGQALVTPADAMAKPKHSIKGLRGGEVGHTNSFFIKGKVATFPKGKIKVLRNVAGGSYSSTRRPRPGPAASSAPRSTRSARRRPASRSRSRPPRATGRPRRGSSAASKAGDLPHVRRPRTSRCGAGCDMSPDGYCRAGPVQARVPPTNPTHVTERKQHAPHTSRLTVDGDPSGGHDVAGPDVALEGVARQRCRGREGQAEGVHQLRRERRQVVQALRQAHAQGQQEDRPSCNGLARPTATTGSSRPPRPTSRASTTSPASRRRASTR